MSTAKKKPAPKKPAPKASAPEAPTVSFASPALSAEWLTAHHAATPETLRAVQQE